MRHLNLALVLVAVTACSSAEDEPVSWEEFQDRAYYEEDTGIFIMNGDEPVKNIDELAAMYWRYRDQFGGTTEQHSIVHQANGGDSKWSPTQAMNLTYCIRKAGLLGLNNGFN